MLRGDSSGDEPFCVAVTPEFLPEKSSVCGKTQVFAKDSEHLTSNGRLNDPHSSLLILSDNTE